MTRYQGIKKSIEVRKRDVEEAERLAEAYGQGLIGQYYRVRAAGCREDIEFLKAELVKARAVFTLIPGGA